MKRATRQRAKAKNSRLGHIPIRTCVGCRGRGPQSVLLRFVRGSEAWRLDASAKRAPGRGAYLCSHRCARRALKNKRYPGLADAAEGAVWKLASALCASGADVYDKRVPARASTRDG